MSLSNLVLTFTGLDKQIFQRTIVNIFLPIISSPEPKAQGELIVWDLSRRPFTLSNINNSETSWPIINKFHQKHHRGGGLTALGFWLDRIRTLVSMATDSSHRVIMGKIL